MKTVISARVAIFGLTIGVVVSPFLGAESSPENPGQNTKIEAILTRLEKRSEGLKDIRCKVRLLEDDQINLAKRSKQGQIQFLMADPSPHFFIHFDRVEAEGVLGKQEWYLFDGQWLYQGLERIKQVTKQEIAKPGEKVDLFDLENAPFPLPFGQKKDAILRNFDVTLAEPTAADPPDSDHLVCMPKPGTRMSRRYDRLDFFVLRDIDLPGRIIATKNDGTEIVTADFPGLSTQSINAGVTEKDFVKPAVWDKEKYEVVEEPLVKK